MSVDVIPVAGTVISASLPMKRFQYHYDIYHRDLIRNMNHSEILKCKKQRILSFVGFACVGIPVILLSTYKVGQALADNIKIDISLPTPSNHVDSIPSSD